MAVPFESFSVFYKPTPLPIGRGDYLLLPVTYQQRRLKIVIKYKKSVRSWKVFF